MQEMWKADKRGGSTMLPMDLFVSIAGIKKSARKLKRIMRNKPLRDCRLLVSVLKQINNE